MTREMGDELIRQIVYANDCDVVKEKVSLAAKVEEMCLNIATKVVEVTANVMANKEELPTRAVKVKEESLDERFSKDGEPMTEYERQQLEQQIRQEVNAEIQQIKQENEELKKQDEKRLKEIETLKTKLDDTEYEMNGYKEALVSGVATEESLKKQLEDKEKEIAQMNNNNGDVPMTPEERQELDALKKDNEDLRATVESAREQLLNAAKVQLETRERMETLEKQLAEQIALNKQQSLPVRGVKKQEEPFDPSTMKTERLPLDAEGKLQMPPDYTVEDDKRDQLFMATARNVLGASSPEYQSLREVYNAGESYERLCKYWDYMSNNEGWLPRPLTSEQPNLPVRGVKKEEEEEGQDLVKDFPFMFKARNTLGGSSDEWMDINRKYNDQGWAVSRLKAYWDEMTKTKGWKPRPE